MSAAINQSGFSKPNELLATELDPNELPPTELLVEIFGYLSIEGLARASSVCKVFYEIIKNTNANLLIAKDVTILNLETSTIMLNKKDGIKTITKEDIKTIVATCLDIDPNDLPAGSLSAFKKLIKNKEELQKKLDALMNAESFEKESTPLKISCLLHAGARPNLAQALKAHAPESVINMLLEAGAQLDNNRVAVMAGASEDVIRVLLTAGARPDDATDSFERNRYNTSFTRIVSYRDASSHQSITESLEEADAHPNSELVD